MAVLTVSLPSNPPFIWRRKRRKVILRMTAVLRVDEVFGLPINNMELVVLSACQTNVGNLDRENPLRNITAGDELVSLNRAFLSNLPPSSLLSGQ